MPNGIQVGPIYIYFYGIILMLGALVAGWLASVEARRRGMDSAIVWDALIWALIGGIIGARLWHVFTPPPSMVEMGITTWFYFTHPIDLSPGATCLICIRQGGLGIPGAILGGSLALYLFARRRKISFAILADIAAPALALGQAIGRFGNYVNQEVYGAPSNLPWGIRIDPAHRIPGYELYERYHPLFLYESLCESGQYGSAAVAGPPLSKLVKSRGSVHDLPDQLFDWAFLARVPAPRCSANRRDKR